MTIREMMWIGATLGLAACGGGGGGNDAGTGPYGTTPTGGTPTTPTPPANTIQATDALVFVPTSLTVPRTTTVTFTFGSVAHNVVFSGGAGAPANPGNYSNFSVQRTFNTAGTFGFTCTIHTYMSGSITVQ